MMTKSIKLLAAFVTIIFMLSFTNKVANEFIGTYGVSSSNPSQIKLTINSDHTFHYRDFSDSDKKIIAEGTWKLKGRKVVLEDNKTGEKFHNVWTFAENGQVAKSRKGLSFYRLSKIDK
jgi:hypothetical protein